MLTDTAEQIQHVSPQEQRITHVPKTFREYHHGDILSDQWVSETFTPEVKKEVEDTLEPGESVLFTGSNLYCRIWEIPIDFASISGDDSSDADIIVLGEKTRKKLGVQENGKFLLKKDKTDVRHKRYEWIDGQKILDDMATISRNIIAQLEREFYTGTNVPPEVIKWLAERAIFILERTERVNHPEQYENHDHLIPRRDPLYGLITNNLIPEMGIGVLATKQKDGRMLYQFVDPLMIMEDPTRGNDQRAHWRKNLHYMGGILSNGADENNIHTLIMDMVSVFGKVDTDAMLALNSVRLALRLPRDSSSGLVTLGSDGIWRDLLQHHPLYEDYQIYRATGGCGNFERIMYFFDQVFHGTNYTSVSDKQIEENRHAKNFREYLIKALHSEFARAAFTDPADAIFYFFGYFHLGDYIVPQINDITKSYSEAFKHIPQNTLRDMIDLNIVEILPENIRTEAQQGICFFQNVAKVCDQLYDPQWAVAYGKSEEPVRSHDEVVQRSEEEPLPVIRRTNAPESLPEIIAVVLYCAGKRDLIEDPANTPTLERLCAHWTQSGNLTPFYDNVPVNFDMALTVEGIRKSFAEKVSKVSLDS